MTLDRECAGIRVEVSKENGEWLGRLEVTVAGAVETVSVSLDRLIDAYNHPMCYLSAAQVDALFTKENENEC